MPPTTSPTPPASLLETIGNLSRFHREHEKFYSQAPLQTAREIQAHSRALKALAARWSEVAPSAYPVQNPYAGADDLNPPGLVSEAGVLFMEGEGEPAEIAQLKREIAIVAGDCEHTGEWLARAMEHSWQVAGTLAAFPTLADLLAERHRIIADDWQSAGLQVLLARLLRRALEVLGRVDFAPAALRADLAGPRVTPAYLYSSSELLDRASDLIVQSAVLVHENERRWRIFNERVRVLERRNAPARESFTAEEARAAGTAIGIDWAGAPFDVEQFRTGMDVELEHGRRDAATNVTDDELLFTAKIALAHLNEFPDYYTRLEKMEAEAESRPVASSPAPGS